jgi:hypothetical protein
MNGIANRSANRVFSIHHLLATSLSLVALEIGYALLHIGSFVCIIEKLLGLLLALSPLWLLFGVQF